MSQVFREKNSLSRMSKMLFDFFVENQGKVLSHAEIRWLLWRDTYEKSRNLRSNIQTLRASLPKNVASRIVTVRGVGYLMKKE